MPEATEKVQSQWDLDDLLDAPHKYGLPTFEEFAKNPEKYKGGVEQLFEVVDKGSNQLNRLIRKHEYRILGYKCKTLEEVQKIMNAEGIKLDEVTLVPELVRESAGKLTVIVEFKLKGVLKPNGQGSP